MIFSFGDFEGGWGTLYTPMATKSKKSMVNTVKDFPDISK